MPEWFEDESFWDKLYPFLFTESKLEAAGPEVQSVLELAGVEQCDVLDLACGPGRHSIALAKRGFRVTGVDLSSSCCGRPGSGRALRVSTSSGCGRTCAASCARTATTSS